MATEPRLNPVLLAMAEDLLAREKQAADGPVIPPPGADGGMMADPAAGGGAPPMDPSMMGGGMAPPMDPSMMGGAPPMDPSMMAGAAPAPAPAAPAAPAAPGAAPGQQGVKLKPEQMAMDFRLYNIQMQLNAIMNALQVQLPPEALVTPPGSPAPSPDAALAQQQPPAAAGPDPAAAAGGASSAIQPVQPMQGAFPEATKTAMAQYQEIIDSIVGDAVAQESPAIDRMGSPFNAAHPVSTKAAAVAAMLRQQVRS